MPPTDSMYLLAESREHPMHVGGLQLFVPPEGTGPEHVRAIFDRLTDTEDVDSAFRKRPARPVDLLGTLWWAEDETVDFDYHVRHSAVPGPGRVRELLQLTSRWHSSLLDRYRPLWEMHLVEGLADGRFAVYSKIHHSVMDGVSALRTLEHALSTDPDARDSPAPWAPRPRVASESDVEVGGDGGGLVGTLLGAARGGLGLAGQAAGVPPALARIATQAARERDVMVPFEAPRTILNRRVGGARRFAAQTWPMERVRAVATAAGVTLNDVVLAMCGGALREYLVEQMALPDAPLTAMVPVSLKLREGQAEAGGNSVGAIVVSLATDQTDAAVRLAHVHQSVVQAKANLSGLTPLQILAMSALVVAPLGLTSVPGFVRSTPPPFNLIISNVPGPRETLYWDGARLDGVYPASIVLDGQALNITLTSRPDSLDFGIVGCRQSVPHLQRLLGHLEDSLSDLEDAVL
ncbi:MAG: wax ester/triacylglycerol synthase family O-acyltransferase [Nocardioidaceae bacterium]|nr:wax ester/triacylglycerol synthase family O-acyltransferase [Nocardioidaceae bacterium]